MRVICGVRKAQLQHKRITMLTLTTSDSTAAGLTDDEKMELILKSWNTLHAILTDKFGEFDHFTEVTNEGNGVLHIAIAGLPFIYHKRITRLWNVIHGSQIIYLGKMHGSSEGIAGYLMTQYLSNQRCTKVYFRSSKNWICDHFTHYWNILRNCSRNWAAGIYLHQYGRWYYPIDKEQLIINYKKWVHYLVITGKALNYVPSKYDFNHTLNDF
jgi:hypothetical protein